MKSSVLVLLVLLVSVLRLLPHAPNAAPLTAFALLGGMYLSRRTALAVPLAASLLTDLVLGLHSTMVWVYGSYVLIALLGMLVPARRWPYLVAASFTASWTFFLVTNFGVWLTSGMYALTRAGLWQCFVAAIPFFRNALAADIFYVLTLQVIFNHFSTQKRAVSARAGVQWWGRYT